MHNPSWRVLHSARCVGGARSPQDKNRAAGRARVIMGIKGRSEFAKGLSVRGDRRKNVMRTPVCSIFYSEVLSVMGLREVKPGVVGTSGISSDISQAVI